MPFLELFEDINNERGDEKVDPTNVPCERVFGVLKYAEKALLNLQFGLLAKYAMAKFKVFALLPTIDTAKVEEFHSEISDIEKKMKQDKACTTKLVLVRQSLKIKILICTEPLLVK